jgi:hypothetical protein
MPEPAMLAGSKFKMMRDLARVQIFTRPAPQEL